MATGKHLTEFDRNKIKALFNQKISKISIASEIGCHLSTVYRELSKGYYNGLGRDLKPEIRYSATIAQKTHDDNRDALRRYKITRKKDNQVSGAGPTKSSGISGTNSGYPPKKDCICR